MTLRNTTAYTTTEGNFFPDAEVDDSIYYSIDVSSALADPTATIDSVLWILPNEITGTDPYMESSVSKIKLTFTSAGTFTIKIKVTSTYATKTSIKHIPMQVKVFG